MPELQIEAAREEHRFYPYTGIFFANRHSFWAAGQNSYILPPAQNPDDFLQLTNVEPVTQGILQRRRGYSIFNLELPSKPFQRAYSYRNDSQNKRFYIWSSPAQVQVTDEVGNVPLNALFAPAASARVPRMILSRDFAYFADGVPGDYRKWDGNTLFPVSNSSLSTWGIDVNNSVGGGGNSSAAPTAATNDSNGTQTWANPTNIFVQDGVDAIQTLTQNQTAANLKATGFNFAPAIPANATILKITVNCSGFVTSSGGFFPGITCQLLRNNVLTGQQQFIYATLSHTTNTAFSYTFVPSSWGYNWTVADVTNSNFGAAFAGAPFAIVDTETFNLDSVTITVVYSGGGGGGAGSITVGTPGTGNITLLSGRTYFYAFQNSRTGHVSDISPPSLTTGPLTNNNVPLSTIPVSNDPQVDTVLVFATADGNDQTTLFLLATLINGTTIYTDNTPDALTSAILFGPALLSNAVYQQTDALGILHGIANNKLPPIADFPVKHKGRLFMAQSHILYFSKNLDEVTTSTGTITSKWEEAWPATNQIDISEFAETIKALLSDGETLWIATERNIRRLIGDSPQNFQKPEIQFNEVGVLSPEVWRVVFYEGQPVGTMWLTPDNKVMASDFNTYMDVGTPIQDVLNTINGSATVGPHASYVNQQAFDLYMLYIPTGSNTAPDTVCVYNLRTKKWCIWKPADQITASVFNINASGTPQWLFASNAGPLYLWDPYNSTSFRDRVGNNPVTYPVTVQTTWLDMGDYSLRKFVNQIIPTTADSLSMTIQVDAASNELDFTSPLSVVPATVVIPAAIPTDVFVPLASGPSHSRSFRFTFVSPPSQIQNILTGFSAECGSFHKY